MRDHGGDVGAAAALYGGDPEDWIDLSTGINRVPYAMPPLPARALRQLPNCGAVHACAEAARRCYGAPETAGCLPLAGSQAAIQLLPGLRPPGRVAILGPTYNEHAAAFALAGWAVDEVAAIGDLAGYDAAVVVNPNNPDGRRWHPETLAALVNPGRLVIVDESFADVDPELSLCPRLGPPGLLVLRSFGKFFGLAGLRLGFALGSAPDIALLRAAAGPWPVSGPALAVGTVALADTAWADATRVRLATGASRLDSLAACAGWRVAGGTALFRLYDAGDAAAAQDRLARARIWSRTFAYAPHWLRLGLPGEEAEWQRLAAALTGVGAGRRP